MNTSSRLAVRPVRNGRGLIALRAWARGATVCRVRGRIVSAATVWGYWQRGDERRGANCYRYDADRYLDPRGDASEYVNHSCAPNTVLVRDARGLKLVALRALAAGEEITFDYSTQIGADDIWTLRCNCGEAACRRVVRDIGRLPAALLRRYRRLGAVPDFILDTLRA